MTCRYYERFLLFVLVLVFLHDFLYKKKQIHYDEMLLFVHHIMEYKKQRITEEKKTMPTPAAAAAAAAMAKINININHRE